MMPRVVTPLNLLISLYILQPKITKWIRRSWVGEEPSVGRCKWSQDTEAAATCTCSWYMYKATVHVRGIIYIRGLHGIVQLSGLARPGVGHQAREPSIPQLVGHAVHGKTEGIPPCRMMRAMACPKPLWHLEADNICMFHQPILQLSPGGLPMNLFPAVPLRWKPPLDMFFHSS